ncbi:MAG TPA: class I SAM-dependent methyltransferase [Actinomycetota bacterium]|nr:class I SAM-dependent methyltransferase [Actinomycetota bacterium]
MKEKRARVTELGRKVSAVTAYLVGGTVTKPSTVRRSLRKALGGILDDRFEVMGALTPLPPSVIGRIYSREVVLPPMALLESGNQNTQGLLFLASLGLVLDARSVFEIGTYNGVTAWCLAKNLPHAVIHTLDLPPREQATFDLNEDDIANRIEFDRRAYETLPHEGTVNQLLGDSARFDFSPWRQACDLIYVDGAHSVDYVRSDTAAALGMLSSGGAIVWDDYWRLVPSVRDALSEETDLSLWRVPDTRLVVHLAPGAWERLEGSPS